MKKIYIKYKLFEMVSVVVGMLLAACSDSHYSDLSEVDDEYVDVTFTLTPETALSTRADDGSGPVIGRGTMIDMLIYAVYLEDPKTHKLTHLTQYGKDGIVDAEDNKVYQYYGEGEYGTDKDNTILPPLWKTPAIPDRTAFLTHKGQTIVSLGEKFQSYSLSLRLMRTANYRIAFWAQSSKTDAYDTSDLMAVKVRYSKTGENDESENYPNNDESRDAFCKVDAFSMETSASGNIRSVQLTRPFAQINVGTTEADYEKKSQYKYSQIELSGVSDQINVVEDIVSPCSENPQTVTFVWAKIPQNEYRESLSAVSPDETEKQDFKDFKYLSMCYVLVPTKDQTDQEEETTVKFSFRFATDKQGADATTAETVDKLPVRRNWRTNILGGLNGTSIYPSATSSQARQKEYITLDDYGSESTDARSRSGMTDAGR